MAKETGKTKPHKELLITSQKNTSFFDILKRLFTVVLDFIANKIW